MLFSSLTFIFIFLPVIFVSLHLLQRFKHFIFAKGALIVASFIFYAYFKVEYIFILFGSILINFFIARFITSNNHGGGNRRNSRKLAFIFGICFNVLLLGFFKYTDFLLENFNLFSQLLNLDFNIPLPHILLPLALSFVTFQQIAFLCDCYKGEVEEINFLDYALFISFFPQLIAGPIVHHKEMMPQFAKNKSLDIRNINRGIFIFSIGLFKKVFIADNFAKWADLGFKNADSLNIFEAWATSLSYTFQIYFDFSGYCDMAIGLGLLFGIMLPINFNSPYKSLNISEFWRRWHMTLGRFLKDYLYIPLGGNRAKKILTLRNIFIAVFISGIWHGAGFGFIIWGVLHGMAMIIHRIYSWASKGARFKENIVYKLFMWFLTFNFINIARIFFRAENIHTAMSLLKNMFFGKLMLPSALASLGAKIGLDSEYFGSWLKNIAEADSKEFLVLSIASFFIILCFKNTLKLEPNRLNMSVCGLLFFIAILHLASLNAESPFLYFNF